MAKYEDKTSKTKNGYDEGYVYGQQRQRETTVTVTITVLFVSLAFSYGSFIIICSKRSPYSCEVWSNSTGGLGKVFVSRGLQTFI
jgi:hypothetical protein